MASTNLGVGRPSKRLRRVKEKRPAPDGAGRLVERFKRVGYQFQIQHCAPALGFT